ELVTRLRSRFHQYMKYFLEEDVCVKDVPFTRDPAIEALLFGFDVELSVYDTHRLYLIDQNRYDSYNAYMGHPMIKEDIGECNQAISEQNRRIDGTAYAKMVQHQPW